MFSVGSLFLLALLAFSAMGSPVEVRNSPITLPMTRRLAFSNMTDLLRHDEARLAAFTEYSTHDRRINYHIGLSSAELSTTHEWGYTVRVGIGYPFTTYNLIIDTTSAITWCGAPYLSNSGTNIEVPVAHNYGYGTFAGTLWEDRFVFDEHITIPKMQFGVASSSQAIIADGVLGLAPTGTALVGLPNSPPITIPSVIDRLIEQGTISRPIVGILFKPIDENAATTHGQISFGGSDRYMYTNIEWT
ncbi:acid protease [Suillus decipiens]|nr:acid protease [Suillus decipiens]